VIWIQIRVASLAQQAVSKGIPFSGVLPLYAPVDVAGLACLYQCADNTFAHGDETDLTNC